MHAYGRCTPMRYTPMEWRGTLMRGTPMTGTPMRWLMGYARLMRWPTGDARLCERDAYEMPAYEMAYGKCTPMGCPSMGCIPCEMHAYERHAYGRCPPMGERGAKWSCSSLELIVLWSFLRNRIPKKVFVLIAAIPRYPLCNWESALLGLDCRS